MDHGGKQMLQIGKTQDLVIVKTVDFGVYLAESRETMEDRVLLPRKQVPKGAEKGSTVRVFLYRDSSDRLISTTSVPAAELGQIAVLKVKAVGKIGAFLDWGLEKDLFLPFKEQTGKVKAGDVIPVAVYLDKSERLCATMKIHPYLKYDPPYQIGDMVPAYIYEINPKFGLFIALEGKYSGLIQKKEAQGQFCIGDKLLVRVVNIREDGQTDASPKQKAYLQIESDSDLIFNRMDEMGGILPFDDHADPQVISNEFGLSKAAFKRAVGHLLKEKKISIKNGRIYIVNM